MQNGKSTFWLNCSPWGLTTAFSYFRIVLGSFSSPGSCWQSSLILEQPRIVKYLRPCRTLTIYNRVIINVADQSVWLGQCDVQGAGLNPAPGATLAGDWAHDIQTLVPPTVWQYCRLIFNPVYRSPKSSDDLENPIWMTREEPTTVLRDGPAFPRANSPHGPHTLSPRQTGRRWISLSASNEVSNPTIAAMTLHFFGGGGRDRAQSWWVLLVIQRGQGSCVLSWVMRSSGQS